MGRYYDNVVDAKLRWSDIKYLMDYGLIELPNNIDPRILDIGCAEGYVTYALYNYLHSKGKYLTRINAFDIGEDKIKSIKNDNSNIKFQVKDVCLIPPEYYTQFDMIFCLGVLQKMKIYRRIPVIENIFSSQASTIVIRVPNIEEYYHLSKNKKYYTKIIRGNFNQGVFFIFNKVPAGYPPN